MKKKADSNSRRRLDDVIIAPSAAIAEALARLDSAGTGALALCSVDGKLFGVLTDGDVRRAMMQKKPLAEPCSSIATTTPIVAFSPVDAAEGLRLMNRHDINHLPVVDAERVLVDFLLRKDFAAEGRIETSSRQRLDRAVISPSATLAEAIACLDDAGTGALVLCSHDRMLSGLLTDGDIRRAVLRGVSSETPCDRIASMSPRTAQHTVSAAEALDLMDRHDINQLPLIDDEGNVVDLLLRTDISGEGPLDISAVIMAGGYGKRLLPLTEQVPKPMLPVGDRPLLELTIQQLRRSGIHDVSLTTHYLSESITSHFGNGERFGVRLQYVREEQPMGTAGGLRLLKKSDRPLLVINGDILTGVSFQEMLAYHRRHRADITVGVRTYEIKVPFGVVECNDARITRLREKPLLTHFINAGIYLLEPAAYDHIPSGERFDMTDLIQKLLDQGQMVVSFPIIEYWLDIGRHDDYLKAQDDIREGKMQ